jgi:hypothetical protein
MLKQVAAPMRIGAPARQMQVRSAVMAMARAVRSGGRAEELVDRMRADWIGERWDDVVIDDVRLLSPGDQWPPVIRLDYRIGDQPGRWIETWDGLTFRTDSLEAASGLWLSIVSRRLMDLTEPPAEDRP